MTWSKWSWSVHLAPGGAQDKAVTETTNADLSPTCLGGKPAQVSGHFSWVKSRLPVALLLVPEVFQLAKGACLSHVGHQDWDIQSGLNCSLPWVGVLACNLGLWILRGKMYLKILLVVQREKDKCRMISLNMWNLKYDTKWTYLWNRKRLTDIENRLVVAKVGEWCRGSLVLADANYYI